MKNQGVPQPRAERNITVSQLDEAMFVLDLPLETQEEFRDVVREITERADDAVEAAGIPRIETRMK